MKPQGLSRCLGCAHPDGSKQLLLADSIHLTNWCGSRMTSSLNSGEFGSDPKVRPKLGITTYPYLCVLLVWIVGGGMHPKTAMLEKILKFWGMRCTKHCNARKIPKVLKFRDLWPSILHSLQNFRIFVIFRALQCLVHLMPHNFRIFRVWYSFTLLPHYYHMYMYM